MKNIVRNIGIVLATGALTLAAACSSSSSSSTTTAPQKYYVSLGDSYAVGYQPGIGATSGYAGYVASKLHLKLANFGCAGATTTSILNTVGCPDVLPGTAGLQRYPATTQIAAAAKFISEHRSQIGLITVSISGNDVTACAKAADAISCVGAALSSIKTNVTQLASQLRTSAGAGVPIYGLTYPDVLLGAYVYPTHPATASQINIAQLSVPAFKSLINPALQSIYEGVSGTFIDVTANTGAYTPLTETVNDPTYGTIPKATAEVCTLTWYCAKGDIHSKNVGYDAIGKMIVDSYNAAK